MRSHITRLVAITVAAVVAISQAGAATFAIVNADNGWAVDLRTKLDTTGLISSVDIDLISVSVTTPSVGDLSAYDAVVVFGNGGSANPTALGDNLADYVDAGGGVTTMIFGYGTTYIAGRWVADGYAVFPNLGYNAISSDSLGAIVNPGSFPADQLFNGVNTVSYTGGGYECYFSGVNAGSELVASWSSGRPLVGFNMPNGKSYMAGYAVGVADA